MGCGKVVESRIEIRKQETQAKDLPPRGFVSRSKVTSAGSHIQGFNNKRPARHAQQEDDQTGN